MKVRFLAVLGVMFAAGVAQAAPLYRWVDAQGNVHYTDSAPPQEAKASEEKKFAKSTPSVALPYGLQQAMKLYPVTLYAAKTECGDACDAARKLLERRGIPHTEKDASDPAVQEEIKKLTGGTIDVPVLKVGKSVSKGFLESAWNTALDSANYPKTSQLPRNYANKQSDKSGKAAPVDAKSDGTAPANADAKSSGEGTQIATGPKDNNKAPADLSKKPTK